LAGSGCAARVTAGRPLAQVLPRRSRSSRWKSPRGSAFRRGGQDTLERRPTSSARGALDAVVPEELIPRPAQIPRCFSTRAMSCSSRFSRSVKSGVELSRDRPTPLKLLRRGLRPPGRHERVASCGSRRRSRRPRRMMLPTHADHLLPRRGAAPIDEGRSPACPTAPWLGYYSVA